VAAAVAAEAAQPAQAAAAPEQGEGSPTADPGEGTETAQTSEASEGAEVAPAPAAPKPARPVVAVRGDDRPGQRKTEPAAARPGRRDARPGERGAERGDRGARGAWPERREDRGPRLGDAAFRAQREAREHAEQALRKLAAQAHGETLTQLLSAWKDRQADALPAAQALGKGVQAAARQAWAQALARPAQSAGAAPSLLRLEMAAEVPTPAEHLAERRALQLQLLTRRNEAGPAETWAQDVAQVLGSAHDEASARRLQNALRQLLRR
jgi:hypothetical protein